MTKKLSFMSKKVFFSSNWTMYSYTKFFCCFDLFLQKWQGQKCVFLIKLSHIQLHLAFLLFWSIFTEINKKNCLLGQKSVFLIKLSHIQFNLAFLLYWSIFTEIDQKLPFISKKCFSHQIEPNTAKLSFSAVLKYF